MNAPLDELHAVSTELIWLIRLHVSQMKAEIAQWEPSLPPPVYITTRSQ